MLSERSVLLIIGGGVAAYKSLELIRLLRRDGARVRCVLTESARAFVTPLSVASLSGEPPAADLFDAEAEARFSHIRLSRAADLIVVAPATANLLARMANGLGSDLATTLLLATDAPVLAAPAMNVRMWEHPATRRNAETLRGDGVAFVGPDQGEMACGEQGYGRMAEPEAILAAIKARLAATGGGLKGRTALVTAGPTHEPVDPVRYLGNRSSGKQGRAIARALAEAGAAVTLVAGPGASGPLRGCRVRAVETAQQMRAAALAALPVDLFVAAAAVADWRPANPRMEKMKRMAPNAPAPLALVPNPDILAEIGRLEEGRRPALVIGFAAETGNPTAAARAKRVGKGCDWVLGNDVGPSKRVFGGEKNQVVLVTDSGEEAWPKMTKDAVARRLTERVVQSLGNGG